MKSIIKKVLEHPSLVNRPPVLVDIGASGGVPEQWQLLAPYSVCVAFDADTRDFRVSELENGEWRKLYSLNRLVASKASDAVDFYLTKSPYCSSTLHPDNDALKPWAFSALFAVEKTVQLPAVDLHSALEEIGLNYIDWYKTDSQGTDLRIFDALPKNIVEKIIAAEFEPGIIDAYKGEDKLHQLMAYMDNLSFWVSHMEVKGSQRVTQDNLQGLSALQRRYIGSFLKAAPGWCEISYINKFDNSEMLCREYLLAWIFSTIKGEHGFAIQVAKDGARRFQDPLFGELNRVSHRYLSSTFGYFSLAKRAMRRVGRRFS
jgi:hypothetical protein